MKNTFLIFALIFSFQFANAQEFKTSSNYFLSFQSTLSEDNQEQQQALLLSKENATNVMTYFPISHSEGIEDIAISTMKSTHLEGVAKIIKIDITYIEYCKYVVSNYILETQKGSFIQLPMLTNEFCNDSVSEFVYLFPSQKFGKDNTIITAQITLENAEITSIANEDTLIWNDDSYGNTGQFYEDF